jgi:RND family efflux transporter MFP subunit
VVAVLAGGCWNGHSGKPAPRPVEVTVTTPITAPVWDYQDFTGRLSAVDTIDIRARVTGYVNKALFKEGDRVTKDQVLFEIDSRSYKAELNLARANLKLAEAQRDVQAKVANRAHRMAGSKAVAQEDYELALANLEKDRAQAEAAEAQREKAQLYFDWTQVRAPISGRISRRLVDPGNLIMENNTILTTVVSEDPLHAYFDVDERTYLNLLASSAQALSSLLFETKFPVLMRLANEDDFTHAGTINFIDNQISPTTGTIRMRGVFRNATGYLRPGLFARVRLPIGSPYQAILVPDEALLSDQGRKYVYVVNDKNEAVYRRVVVGQALKVRVGQADLTLRVIRPPEKGQEGKEGLAEGERVIIVNQQRLRPGARVTVRTQPPPPRPDSPFGKLLVLDGPARGAKGQANAETQRRGAAETRGQREGGTGRVGTSGGAKAAPRPGHEGG